MSKYDQKLASLEPFYFSDTPQPDGEEFQQRIAELQQQLVEELPHDYIDFLRSGGFMVFIDVRYPVADRDGNADGYRTIQAFFGFTGDAYDLFNVLDNHDELADDGYLLIGLDPLGNLICLDLMEGTVWFYTAATEQLSLVANSFDTFIQSLERMETS